MQTSMIYPELHEELLRVHDVLATRENLSSQMISCAAKVEKDFGSACIMAIASLGGLHAPIEQAMKLLSDPNAIRTAEVLLQDGSKVPGWGSSFVKEEKDPIFDTLDYMLYSPGIHTKFGTLWHLITDITDHLRSKEIYPNAACYTAACCILNEIPPCVAVKTLIQGRIDSWSDIYTNNYNPRLP
jgi:hypothetical protein